MLRFLLRVIGEAAFIFFLSFTLIFFLLRGLGDPAQMLLGQRTDQASLEAIRAQLHLDEPLWKQYLHAWADWLPYRAGRWQKPSLGFSYQYKRPVWELYMERLPATALLGLTAMAIASVLGIGGGLYQAFRPSKLLERLSLLLLALPGYVIGLILLLLFALKGGLPLGGYVREFDPIEERFVYRWEALILPMVALSLRPAAYLFQLTAHQAQALLQADFIRTAFAKGKPAWQVLLQDVGRNLLPPLAMSLSQWIASVFVGAVFIEELFDWPGVGRLLFSALISSDFPLLLGTAQLSTLLFVLLHTLSEVLSRWADPRLRLSA